MQHLLPLIILLSAFLFATPDMVSKKLMDHSISLMDFGCFVTEAYVNRELSSDPMKSLFPLFKTKTVCRYLPKYDNIYIKIHIQENKNQSLRKEWIQHYIKSVNEHLKIYNIWKSYGYRWKSFALTTDEIQKLKEKIKIEYYFKDKLVAKSEIVTKKTFYIKTKKKKKNIIKKLEPEEETSFEY